MMAVNQASNGVVSGELLFNTNSDIRRMFENVPKLNELLKLDNKLLSVFQKKMDQIKLLQQLSQRKFKECQSSEIVLMKQKLDVVLTDLKSMKEYLCDQFDCYLKDLDAVLIQLVLNYYAVLRVELDSHRQKTTAEDAVLSVKAKHFERVRDMKIFAYHLAVETKEKVCVHYLPSDSVQSVRCSKAVTDNVKEGHLSSIGFKNSFQILSVLKIENSWLSERLERSVVAAGEDGRIKGLFCQVPAECIHRFIAYGYEVEVPEHSRRSSPSKKKDSTPTGHSAQSSHDTSFLTEQMMFHTPWYYYNNPATHSSPSKSYRKPASMVSNQGLARQCVTKSEIHSTAKRVIKFNRYSTPSTLGTGRNPSTLTYLALCRVVISKLKTVSGEVTPQMLLDYRKTEFDALYCLDTEEYVILQPQCVLPEFVMEIQYEKQEDVKTHTVVNSTTGTVISPRGCSLDRTTTSIGKAGGTQESDTDEPSKSCLPFMLRQSVFREVYPSNALECSINQLVQRVPDAPDTHQAISRVHRTTRRRMSLRLEGDHDAQEGGGADGGRRPNHNYKYNDVSCVTGGIGDLSLTMLNREVVEQLKQGVEQRHRGGATTGRHKRSELSNGIGIGDFTADYVPSDNSPSARYQPPSTGMEVGMSALQRKQAVVMAIHKCLYDFPYERVGILASTMNW